VAEFEFNQKQVWWFTPVIPALWRLSRGNLRLGRFRAIYMRPYSRNNLKKKNEGLVEQLEW
jgi:hypothetical protein